MCESVGMAQTVCILPAAEDGERLLAIVSDRNRPLKHVQRARIILFSAERLPVLEVARRPGASHPAVWRWQARYANVLRHEYHRVSDTLIWNLVQRASSAPENRHRFH